MAKGIFTAVLILILIVVLGVGLFLFGLQAIQEPTLSNLGVFSIYSFVMVAGLYELYRKTLAEFYGVPEEDKNDRTNSSRNRH